MKTRETRMPTSNATLFSSGKWALFQRLISALAALLAISLIPSLARAQDPDDPGYYDPPEDPDEPEPPRRNVGSGSGSSTADFSGSLQVVRGPGGAAPPSASLEIFPDASKVWVSIRDVDPIPVETARQGGKWLCAGGGCTATVGETGQSSIGDEMLRSIKLQTPNLPLPLTIWGRMSGGRRVLDFDPILIGRRSYAHIAAYAPVPTDQKKVPKIQALKDGREAARTPDMGELTLGLQWPRQAELADFRYLAIVDSCGNARVQPFQRTFTVPVFLVASGGCGSPDGTVLRIFPSGGWIRVTAFNLEQPASGNVVNATYRVSVPALENLVESNPARLLFPDPVQADLQVDCGPTLRKAPSEGGIPTPPPGAQMVKPGAAPPPPASAPPGAKPPAPPAGSAPSAPPGTPPKSTPPPGATPATDDKSKPTPPAAGPVAISPSGPPPSAPPSDTNKPGPQPLAHQSLVIAPEPLRLGNCRVSLMGQTKRRLVAPLALHVSLQRTDRTSNGAPIELLPDGKWIVTPSNAEFMIPALSENFDGDSRLRLAVYSDPLSPDGKVVLLSDAARVASSLRSYDPGEAEGARRLVGTVTIHSVPLCGETNFETVENAGTCLRAYITVPAMIGTLQVTRAPWVEKPIFTRSVLSAVGVALAVDNYDPVQRRAFPVAGQVGGFVQSLGDGRVGFLGYIGIAPTIPVLGSGGNTTSVGLLAGIGLEYITNETGPDEGLKPAAFLSLVVQVGQASPASFAGGGTASASGSFGFGQ
ncbi:MAG: hypothetical protein IPK82_23050 [Polyangiaceae bacterium]|nr:hypothetical protein [Polyangiaceae bacterium]